jgi:predicted metal-dependent phosphoesterase TrpH
MTPGLRLDLHVHSLRSPDGRDEVDRLVARVESLQLNGLALTDHNTVAGHARLAELARARPALRLLPGVEVSTREGHLLAYGLHEAPPPGRPVGETVDWVTSRGGIPVAAHPFRRFHGVGGAVARTLGVPALEVVNAHNGPWANEHAREVAVGRSLGSTGGSDAHLAGEVGVAWTQFPEGADSVDDLLTALGRGATTAGGRSAGLVDRTRIALRSLGMRVQRGFRPI